MSNKQFYQDCLQRCEMLSDEELDAFIIEQGMKMNELGEYDSHQFSTAEHHLMWMAAIDIQGKRKYKKSGSAHT